VGYGGWNERGGAVIGPDRTQLRWDLFDLDSQLPDDHRARLVWAFVEGLDLSEFYDRIKARDAVAGRPATDPRVVLAVWLYATLEGIGSARAIDRLCQQHAAYRWLCGGAPINHDLLAGFRRENAVLLDRLLTQSVTGLIAEKLITLEELAIDGTKVRACAGPGSLCKRKRLERIEQAVAERVPELKSELDTDPGEPERQRKKRALQAAQERAQRVARARQKLAELEQEKAARAKTHATEEANKGEPKVSVSNPEARLMRLADGAVAPAWNVQVATAEGFVARSMSSVHAKLLAFVGSSVPLYCGSAGEGQRGRAKVVTPPTILDATIWSGAMPCSTHRTSGLRKSTASGPAPPLQCATPGWRNSRTNSCVRCRPSFRFLSSCGPSRSDWLSIVRNRRWCSTSVSSDRQSHEREAACRRAT
jgi:transposase